MNATFALDAAGPGRWQARGTLGLATATAALARGLTALKAGERCQFDLQEIDDADSAGLAVLIEWLAQARKRGVRLEYLNLPIPLRSLARLSGIEFLFPETPAAT